MMSGYQCLNSEEFCCMGEHALDLMRSLSRMRENSAICDFVVHVAKQTFRVHRSVLFACSDYFSAMLTHDTKEKRENFVRMHDIEPLAFKVCIDFMYTGCATLDMENATGVLQASSLLQMERLKGICYDYFKKNLTAENCLQIRSLAQLYSGESLLNSAETFVRLNFEAVIDTTSFRGLVKTGLTHFMKPIGDDGIIWKAIVIWVRHDIEDREKHLLELMMQLKFSTFSAEVISKIWSDEFVQRSEACKDYVLARLFSKPDVLEENVDVDNCLLLKELAQSYGHLNDDRFLGVIHKTLNEFMANNFGQVAEQSKFLDLDQTTIFTVYELLEMEVVSCDKFKLESAIKWVKHDLQRRVKHAPGLLRLIDFTNISQNFIDRMIEHEPLVAGSSECRNILETASRARASGAGRASHFAVLVTDANRSKQVLWVREASKKNWKEKSSFQIKEHAKIVSYNRRLFTLTADGTLHLSDEDASTLYDVSKMPHSPTQSARLVSDDDFIYVVETDRMSTYSVVCDRWTVSDSGCDLGDGFCLANADDALYAIGGRNTTTTARTYDKSSKIWKTMPPPQTRRCFAAAAVLEEKLYLLGGTQREDGRYGSETNDVECYDLNTKSWKKVSPMQEPRMSFNAIVFDKKLHAFMGSPNGNSIEVYDTHCDWWAKIPAIGGLPHARPLQACLCSIVTEAEISEPNAKRMRQECDYGQRAMQTSENSTRW